jgi:anti-sigma regulatory factor (Ser/Thr protein kinase)
MSDNGQIAVSERLAGTKDAPRIARDAAAHLLGRLGCGAERADDVALIISELVTNAVVHGPHGHDVMLGMTGTPHLIRIEVSDEGTAPFEWPGDRLDGHRGLGLGLGLVRQFADRSGLIFRPWTVAWCELDLDGAR